MPVIAVMNRKGGSGKSTLSTNIAAWCAHSGWQVMLGDIDRQQSVRSWLQRRPEAAAPITTWAVDNGRVFRAPRGTTHVVLDTPGALYDYEQSKLLVWLDAVLVPIGPSLFDREASLTFLEELRRHPRVSSGKCKIAVIGMRWPPEAIARWQQGEGTWEQSLLTVIPEDPRYRTFLDNGSSVFDGYSPLTQQDMLYWSPLLKWLNAVWSGSRTSTGPAPAAARQTTAPPQHKPAMQDVPECGVTNTAMADQHEPVHTAPVDDRFIPAYLLQRETAREVAHVTAEAVAPADLAQEHMAGTNSLSVRGDSGIFVGHSAERPHGTVLRAPAQTSHRGEQSAFAAHANSTAQPPGLGAVRFAGGASAVAAKQDATSTRAMAIDDPSVRASGAAQAPPKEKNWLSRWFNLA